MTTIAPAVKEERHDEAEIVELAAKMVEAHKTLQAKQANQALLNTTVSAAIQQGNPGSIINYLQRKQTTTMAQPAIQQQLQSSNGTSNGHSNTTTTSANATVDDGKPADDESLKGHFGWESFNSGKTHIPYIIRQSEKYCAVRIVEQKLVNKYLNVLHQDLYNCTNVSSYYITDVEARLLDEINFKHCDQYFGKEKFSMKDLIVRLTDAQRFQQFLDVCYKKLTNCSTPNDKCGFIRINQESVVPYTVRDGQKMVPLFYFEGETDNLKLKADSLSGWDLSYLKFCCKVQGIRNELFASETVAVISLDDIKSYFPQGTIFEDYWPNKVVDTQLLVTTKSHNSSTISWTHPPPKQQVLNPAIQRSHQQIQQQQQQQQQQQKQQQQQRSFASNNLAAVQSQMYGSHGGMEYLRNMQRTGMTNQQASLAALASSNGWNNQFTQSQINEMLRLTNQNKANASTRNYSSRQQQQLMQNLLQSQFYPYNNTSAMTSNGHSNNGTQQPPPLVRSSQNQAQLSSGSTAQLRSSTNPPTNNSTSYHQASNNVNSNSNNNSSNIVTITRCPPANGNIQTQSQNNQNPSSYLNRIPASTTITPTQYYNKDTSLPSSMSVYPKNNAQSVNARSVLNSTSVSPVIASPTRASPQAGYAKQPSLSPASPMHNLLPAVIQQQLDELLAKQNFNLNSITNPDILKETLLNYTNLYAKAQQQVAAGNVHMQSQSSSSQSYPIRNKSVITATSRAMDVIDLSASNSPIQRSAMPSALQLQQAQAAAAVAAAASKRSHNGQYMNGNQTTTRSMQSSSSSANTRATQNALGSMNGYYPAFKIEKSFIESQMVHCINAIAYSPNSDMLIPLSELRDQFYPNVGLDMCKRVMQALDITLFSGAKGQYQAYSEMGKPISDNVPFVRICDVIAYMTQINYMVRNQIHEAKNASKRARIS